MTLTPTDIHEQWAERSGAFDPTYYAYYGHNGTSEALGDLLESVVGRDAAVLELGCSSGRHLAHLHERGFEALHGIEINEDAFDVMAETYPELAEAGTFYADAMEAVVPAFPDDRFDVVYSVQTLQHVHPDNEWVFDDLARIAAEALVTVEHEDDPEEPDEPVGDGSDEREASPGDDPAAVDPADPDSSVRRVSYVHDEFPLYVRDWDAVFTERGMAEFESRSLRRDRLRAFRPADE